MEFVLVPKGKSWLGGGGGKPGTKEVEMPDDFYLGKFEVTQEEWEKLMGSNPSAFKEVGSNQGRPERFPVEKVSWEDEMVPWAAKRQGKGIGLDVSPAEGGGMKYACRGGPLADTSRSAFDFYLDRPTNQLQRSRRTWRMERV